MVVGKGFSCASNLCATQRITRQSYAELCIVFVHRSEKPFACDCPSTLQRLLQFASCKQHEAGYHLN